MNTLPYFYKVFNRNGVAVVEGEARDYYGARYWGIWHGSQIANKKSPWRSTVKVYSRETSGKTRCVKIITVTR